MTAIPVLGKEITRAKSHTLGTDLDLSESWDHLSTTYQSLTSMIASVSVKVQKILQEYAKQLGEFEQYEISRLLSSDELTELPIDPGRREVEKRIRDLTDRLRSVEEDTNSLKQEALRIGQEDTDVRESVRTAYIELESLHSHILGTKQANYKLRQHDSLSLAFPPSPPKIAPTETLQPSIGSPGTIDASLIRQIAFLKSRIKKVNAKTKSVKLRVDFSDSMIARSLLKHLLEHPDTSSEFHSAFSPVARIL